MDMDLIEAFCQLAEKEHYGLASQALFVSQSALTKRIQRLEDEVGCVIFERGRGGAKLTAAGKSLLPEAKRLVANFHSFREFSRNVSAGKCGLLKVGYGISSYQFAPTCISSFKASYPDVHVTLDDIPSCKQIDMLLKGEIQVSFNRLPVSYPLVSIPTGTDRLALAIHKSVIIDEKNIFESIKGLEYMRLAMHRGPGLVAQIEKYLYEANIHLHIAREAKDILTLLSMVSANIGYTIIPSSAKVLSQQHIKYIPLPYVDSKWSVGIVWNKEIEDPIRDNFINHIESVKNSEPH